MQKFLVATGAAPPFHIEANDPAHAIEILKGMIRERKNYRRHATIGMSLVHALEEGRLNFIVFDAGRTEVLAGELNGQFQQPATRELATAMQRFVPADLFYKLGR